MEFDNVGTRCAVQDCGQRDFLPFECDGCHTHYCLEHRSVLAHNCAGQAHKDITSIACPVCGKSIRMTKADNPDEVWTLHFNTECTQEAQQTTRAMCSAPGHCIRQCCGCRQALGPSNNFTCQLCRKCVCISHRRSEDHACTSRARDLRTQAAASRAAPKSVAHTANTGRASKPPASSKTHSRSTTDESNSVRGTAARRMLAQQARTDAAVCPFCASEFTDPSQLITHVEVHHADGSQGQIDSASMGTAARSTPSEETFRCEQCGQWFPSAVLLVEHAEHVHSPGAHRQALPGNSSSQDGRCLVS